MQQSSTDLYPFLSFVLILLVIVLWRQVETEKRRFTVEMNNRAIEYQSLYMSSQYFQALLYSQLAKTHPSGVKLISNAPFSASRKRCYIDLPAGQVCMDFDLPPPVNTCLADQHAIEIAALFDGLPEYTGEDDYRGLVNLIKRMGGNPLTAP